MPPHIKNERARLLRRREQLLDHLATLDSDAVDELRGVMTSLQLVDKPENTRYAGFRVSKDACRAVLEFEQKWLTKREIADKLLRGGFVMDPEIGPRLVVENLTKNIQRENFIIDEEGRVGLPEWAEIKDKT